jgi:hypothetical protein
MGTSSVAGDDSGLDIHILAILDFTPELNFLAGGRADGFAIMSQLPLRKGLDKLLLFFLVQRVPVPAQRTPSHLRKIETSENQFAGALRQPVRLQLVRVAKEFGYEGIVAKRKDSYYESGKRGGAWVKYKVYKSQEFVIGGYTLGNPLDALVVGYYQDGRLFYAAKVRSGFVPHLRREVADRAVGTQ